jgi:uncharacterized protein YndB with AHSA1/START domain
MSDTETLSVVVEREIAHPPEKIWRALTQPHLIADWLMQNDFKPDTGHKFRLTTTPHGDWNGIIDCQVLAVEPNKSLTYSWGSGDGPLSQATIVRWTLTPTGAGTHLRMEHSGFRPDQPQNYQGAKYGWQSFFGKLEQVLARA